MWTRTGRVLEGKRKTLRRAGIRTHPKATSRGPSLGLDHVHRR